MNIRLKETPEQFELVEAMGSRNMATAAEAQEAFAKFIGDIALQVLPKAGILSSIYSDAPYNEDTDNPSVLLDLFYDEGAGFINVWSQNVAGGLPSNEVVGLQELKVGSYRLDSAASFPKRYARKARLDVVAKIVERMINGVLIKQELNGWAVILKALAEAKTGGSYHVVKATTANTFGLADLSKLMTNSKRVNQAYDGGTPTAPYSRGITDMYVSPEVMGMIRSFAFNPIDSTADNTVQNLPDQLKYEIYRSAGLQSIFNVNLTEMLEFGNTKAYNTLFGGFVVGSTIPGGADTYWSTANDEILVGIDNSRGAFIRPVARDGETGATFMAEVDDQYNVKRVDKAGFYGSLEEGRVCIDGRAIAGVAM